MKHGEGQGNDQSPLDMAKEPLGSFNWLELRKVILIIAVCICVILCILTKNNALLATGAILSIAFLLIVHSHFTK